MTVVSYQAKSVTCDLNGHRYELPCVILKKLEEKPADPLRRRGRKLKPKGEPGVCTIVPGAVFSADDVAAMRDHYRTMEKQLGLDDKPELQREVAAAILRWRLGLTEAQRPQTSSPRVEQADLE